MQSRSQTLTHIGVGLSLIFSIASLGIVSMIYRNNASQPIDNIECTRFVLVDENGAERMRMHLDENQNVHWEMLASNGEIAIGMHASADSDAVFQMSKKEIGEFSVDVGFHDAVEIKANSPSLNNRARVTAFIKPTHGFGVDGFDAMNTQRFKFMIPFSKDMTGVFADKDGNTIWDIKGN